jgi:Ca2+-binding RTX toxin-like protein
VKSRRPHKLAVTAVATAAVAGLGAAPALGVTTVKVKDNVLEIESGAVEQNDITVRKDSNSNIVRVTELGDGPRVSARAGCAQPNNRQASCALGPGGTVSVKLLAGLQDDYDGVGLPFPQTVDGGVGIDDISTGLGNDTLNGGSSADFFDAGPGADRINGESGDDFLDGGPGGDTLSGGSGTDTVRYGAFREPLTVDLSAGFASVFGQTVNDIVFGDIENVHSGVGSDTLNGDQGNNELVGEEQTGMAPSRHPDTLTGLGGNDHIDAGNNRARDTVSCGAGQDSVRFDLTDVASPINPAFGDCEQIQLNAVDEQPAATIRWRRARVVGGQVLVPLSCPRKSRPRCSGRLRVRRRGGATLGRTRYRIRRGGRLTVRVPLSRPGRRLVARPGHLRVEVLARERDSRGRPKVTLARFRLRGS